MRKYIEHIKSKPTHNRRIHAMQFSVGIITVVFVVWITTLGVRLAQQQPVAQDTDGTQSAAVVQSQQGNAQLYVAGSDSQ